MKKSVLLFCISLLLNGCATIGVGTAEITGVALFHDRRDAKTILVDEKIEDDALINLNLDSDIFSNSHFNVTAFNRIVLITGECPIKAVTDKITSKVQGLQDVRMVKNQMVETFPSSFSSRVSDSIITGKIKTALSQDSRLPGFDTTRIKVVTENGRVFLMGLVYQKEGDVAADIARKQAGVKEVTKVFEYI